MNRTDTNKKDGKNERSKEAGEGDSETLKSSFSNFSGLCAGSWPAENGCLLSFAL